MDAVEFLKERKRMCEANYDRETMCSGCCAYDPEGDRNTCKVLRGVVRKQTTLEDFNIAVAIVEKWSEEHPLKTLMDDFFEKFPNAPRDKDDGTPTFCPEEVGYEKEKDVNLCRTSCLKCWARSLKEVTGRG